MNNNAVGFCCSNALEIANARRAKGGLSAQDKLGVQELTKIAVCLELLNNVSKIGDGSTLDERTAVVNKWLDKKQEVQEVIDEARQCEDCVFDWIDRDGIVRLQSLTGILENLMNELDDKTEALFGDKAKIAESQRQSLLGNFVGNIGCFLRFIGNFCKKHPVVTSCVVGAVTVGVGHAIESRHNEAEAINGNNSAQQTNTGNSVACNKRERSTSSVEGQPPSKKQRRASGNHGKRCTISKRCVPGKHCTLIKRCALGKR